MNITDCHCIPNLHKCSVESKTILFQCTCCVNCIFQVTFSNKPVCIWDLLRAIITNEITIIWCLHFLLNLLPLKRKFKRKKLQIKMSWFSTLSKQSFHASGKRPAKKWFEAPSLRRSIFSIRSIHREQRMSLLERIYFCNPTHRVPAWAGRTILFHGRDSFLTYAVYCAIKSPLLIS